MAKGKVNPALFATGIKAKEVPTRGKGRSGMATYRLEPNKELYEGVRYAWLLFEPPRGATVAPWTISGLRIVCKVKPVNYTASYASSDTLIERVWYQGAYAVRLNMEASEFNSILMERGDRVAIQGDGHPTMAAALTAANMSWMQAFGLLHFGYFIMHYFFASQSAHVGALYPAFLSMMLASGAPPMLAAISLAFNTNLFGGLTHYASGQSAVYFSSGAISLPKLWKQGAYMAVINAIIFGVVGMAWWKVIGLW